MGMPLRCWTAPCQDAWGNKKKEPIIEPFLYTLKPAQLSQQSARLFTLWSWVRAPRWVLFQCLQPSQLCDCDAEARKRIKILMDSPKQQMSEELEHNFKYCFTRSNCESISGMALQVIMPSRGIVSLQLYFIFDEIWDNNCSSESQDHYFEICGICFLSQLFIIQPILHSYV